ncbi:NUDIX domain-containing protein [Streptomyces griseocarneus]|uniref:NUDIX domain-containing protein n=1 Tax=Streptomyces griseocarneus TaxID=51201 RepID=UPI00167CB453|nr:NUDIX hydrolase [Streptomyces griseocarneus]MBZ6477741.1 NUDIX hydrolase [Streptomyces griseocarneus]
MGDATAGEGTAPEERAETPAARLARFLRGLPAPLVAVDALVRDDRRRLLIVDPVYKPGWDIVGGFVEAEEDLPTALAREAEEELGLRGLRTGRLLAVDNLSAAAYGRSLLVFIFAAHPGRPVRAEELVLQSSEIAAAEFVGEETALARFPEPLRRRVAASLEAEREDRTVYLRDGLPLPPHGTEVTRPTHRRA